MKTESFSYECAKCGSKYTNLKRPLAYSNCQSYKGRNPNPVLCNGTLNKVK
jgi:DNA-directed RNA polymerase subunit RPC12/RpoP